MYGGFIYFNVIGNMWKIMLINILIIGIILFILLKLGNILEKKINRVIFI